MENGPGAALGAPPTDMGARSGVLFVGSSYFAIQYTAVSVRAVESSRNSPPYGMTHWGRV